MFAPIDLNEAAKEDLRKAVVADVMAILDETDCCEGISEEDGEGSGKKKPLSQEELAEKVVFANTYSKGKTVNESNPCELGGGKPASNGGQTIKAKAPKGAKVVKNGSPAETAGDEEACSGGSEGAVEEDEKEDASEEKPEKREKKDGKKAGKAEGSGEDEEEKPETIDDVIKEIKGTDEELAKRLKDALKLDRKVLKDEIKELKKAAEGGQEEGEAPAEDTGDVPSEEAPAGDGMEEISVDDVELDEADGSKGYSVGSFLVDAKKIPDENLTKPAEVSYEKNGKEFQKKVVDFRYREDLEGNGFLLAGSKDFVRLDQLIKYFSGDKFVLERDDQIEFSESGDDPKFKVTGFDADKNAFVAVEKTMLSEDIDEDPMDIRAINPGISVKCFDKAAIRKILTPDMLGKITALRHNLYDEETYRYGSMGRTLNLKAGTEKDIKQYLLEEATYTVLAFFNDTLIGFLCASANKDGELYFDEDCIDPKYRGLGAATMMIRCMIDAGKADGFNVMLCDVDVNNPASEKQFMRNGFKRFSTKFILTV